MLKDVVKAMDKNGDQVIQYEGMPHEVSKLFCLLWHIFSIQHSWQSMTLQSFEHSSNGRRKSYFHSSIALIETIMAN
jgi:hypothetical protein